jgi:predicted XRE-type DNA-binding protein
VKDSRYRVGRANIFRDLGFPDDEAEVALAKSELISAIAGTIAARKLTQRQAARLCRTDQPTLSKVLRGRMESVTIDRLAAWLKALGRSVDIRVRSRIVRGGGRLTVHAA